jgi:hypothetical protein
VAFSAKVGAFNTGTGAVASTVVVNDVGFQPVALIVWYSLSTSTGTDSTGAGNLNYGIGFATGASDRRTCSIQVENGSANADTDRFTTDAALVQTITISGATAGLLDVQSFDSGGFTLVVDDQFPSSIRVHYLALGGSDITNAATGSFTNGASSPQDVTSVGFAPDAIFFMSVSGTTTPPSNGTTAILSFGACAGASPTSAKNAGTGVADIHSAANMDSHHYSRNGESLIGFSTSAGAATNVRGYVSAWLSNGFTVTWNEGTGSTGRYFHYLALKGGSWILGDLLTQTDTTTDIVESGFGFTPSGAILVSSCDAAESADTVDTDLMISVGAFNSTTSRGAQAGWSEYNTASCEAAIGVEHDEVYLNISTADAVQGLMDVKSVESGGFTCIMDDADPAQAFVWYVAFGGSGTQYPVTVSGGITPAGALARQGQKVITGAISSAGALNRETRRAITGAISSAGALTNQAGKVFAGGISSAGAVSTLRTAYLTMTGALSSAGELTRQLQREITGAIASAGILAKQLNRDLSGALSSAGAVNIVKTVLLDMTGTLASAGELVKQTSRFFTGALSSAGDITRQTAKMFTGTLNSDGVVTTIRTILLTVSGALSSAGALARQTGKAFSGSIAPGGDLVKRIDRALTGSLSAAGEMVRQTGKALAGALTSDGSILRQVNKGLDGTLASAGELVKQTSLAFTGALSSAGDLATQLISGSITSAKYYYRHYILRRRG